MRNIEEKIRNVDWVSYSGPDCYDPNKLVEALIDLSRFDESRAKNGLDNKVLFAVGNNHAGTYYPAVIAAIDLIIEMHKFSENEAVKKCAYAILNNLYYFGAEVGEYNKHSAEQIDGIVRDKLKAYADDET